LPLGGQAFGPEHTPLQLVPLQFPTLSRHEVSVREHRSSKIIGRHKWSKYIVFLDRFDILFMSDFYLNFSISQKELYISKMIYYLSYLKSIAYNPFVIQLYTIFGFSYIHSIRDVTNTFFHPYSDQEKNISIHDAVWCHGQF
jgi:hypothetical protein